MLHKVFGGVGVLSASAAVAAFVGAAQGSTSDTGRDALWIACAVFGILAVAAGVGWLMTREDATEMAAPRQASRQSGHDNRATQQSGDNNQSWIIGRDYIVGGEKNEQDKQKPPNQTFVYNQELSRGVEYPNGLIWWRLTGWMFYRTSSRPNLRFQPHCPQHKKRLLVQGQYGSTYAFSEDLDLSGVMSSEPEATAFLCPSSEHSGMILVRQRLTAARETVRSLLESEAETGGWDRPTAEETAYNGVREG